MTWVHEFLNIVLHLKPTLQHWADSLGPWMYVLLFVIVFCETGLVVTPFLPGDTLLFALGALAKGSHVSLPVTALVLCVAANCGDAVNYLLGYRIGPRVFSRESSWLLNKKHLEEAQRFYDRHGGKTIIMARFIPIVRTFAPFVAGIGRMPFSRFAGFSIAGGVLWVVSILMAGYFFGQVPFVDKHFELVVIAIVAISVLPGVFHWWSSRKGQAGEITGVQGTAIPATSAVSESRA